MADMSKPPHSPPHNRLAGSTALRLGQAHVRCVSRILIQGSALVAPVEVDGIWPPTACRFAQGKEQPLGMVSAMVARRKLPAATSRAVPLFLCLVAV